MEDQIKKTIVELLSDRGYSDTHIDDDCITVPGVLCVYIIRDPKVGVNHMKEKRAILESINLTHTIIVYNQSITSFAKQYIDDMIKDNLRVELFKQSELYFNITKHDVVPKHTLLTVDEKNELVRNLRIIPTQLPHIKHNDAMAKYMGLVKGDVVKIDRKSEITENSIYYRICT
jgi:DNA-directed RNA polymerase I, II, and III subunit RPABC1